MAEDFCRVFFFFFFLGGGLVLDRLRFSDRCLSTSPSFQLVIPAFRSSYLWSAKYYALETVLVLGEFSHRESSGEVEREQSERSKL